MVIFAAATGLRPAEWLALEWRDIVLEARVVYVHRSFTKGRLKLPEDLPQPRWKPAQIATGIEPLRDEFAGVEESVWCVKVKWRLPEGAAAMSLALVQNFSISLDGFGTGEPQSLDAPFGHAGERLHEWMFATRWWREMVGEAGGTRGIDDAYARAHGPGVGAEIMGAGKFGPPGWHDDPEWKGWWGPNPPFHTPVFVLTHQPRPSIEMEGGTTFHFVDASPAEALETAREAADGQDVRIGGGATVIRDFAAAGLIDHMHIAVVPILLGRGVRLWDGLEGLETDYGIESASAPSGVTHVTFTRAV